MTVGRRAVVARITGRVQGVSYRAWTKVEAELLGLSGWVRNEADGSVCALIIGSEPAVSAMIERLRRGPRGAIVHHVETRDAGPGSVASGFRITG